MRQLCCRFRNCSIATPDGLSEAPTLDASPVIPLPCKWKCCPSPAAGQFPIKRAWRCGQDLIKDCLYLNGRVRLNAFRGLCQNRLFRLVQRYAHLPSGGSSKDAHQLRPSCLERNRSGDLKCVSLVGRPAFEFMKILNTHAHFSVR